MQKKIKILSALAMLCVLIQGMMVPAFAAEKPLTAVPAPGLTEVPVSQESFDRGGFHFVTKVFEVSEDTDPYALVESDFEKDGYLFKMDSIVKDSFAETESQMVDSDYSANSETDDTMTALRKIPITVKYNEDGFSGNLYLLPNSLNIMASEYETQTSRWTIRDTITKQVEYNDESVFPDTVQKNGYTLSRTGVTWQEGGYLPDSAIPSYYSGTASYARTLHSSKDVPTDYSITARYIGEATKESAPTYVYTITYRGEEVKADYSNQLVAGLIVVGSLILLVLFVIFTVKLINKVRSLYIKVEAQDEQTGEYAKIQTVRMNKNVPTIELDELKAPSAKHFLITISAAYSEELKGKIVLVKTAMRTYKHQVGSNYGLDYKFNVDLEPIDVDGTPSATET